MIMFSQLIRSSAAKSLICRGFSAYSTFCGNELHSLYSRSCFLSAKRLKSTRERVGISFEFGDGTVKIVKAKVGDSLLDVVIDENVDIDGFGACEGTLSCSTCHLILKKEDYERLPNKPGEEEMDMLDLAYELTDTSRLGCQIEVTKDLDGLVVQVPIGVQDARDA